MARKQGPEEKYYPQVWRFLRRCTSPLPTPREGNTFASRNGLSNRFSHMDQPQFLRHRCARIPGDKRDKQHACGYRPERAAGSGETTGPAPETKMPLPFQAEVKSRIHRFTDRCGKTTEALKQQRMTWSIASGVSSPAGLFSRPDSLRVKRKGILGLLAAY